MVIKQVSISAFFLVINRFFFPELFTSFCLLLKHKQTQIEDIKTNNTLNEGVHFNRSHALFHFGGAVG